MQAHQQLEPLRSRTCDSCGRSYGELGWVALRTEGRREIGTFAGIPLVWEIRVCRCGAPIYALIDPPPSQNFSGKLKPLIGTLLFVVAVVGFVAWFSV